MVMRSMRSLSMMAIVSIIAPPTVRIFIPASPNWLGGPLRGFGFRRLGMGGGRRHAAGLAQLVEVALPQPDAAGNARRVRHDDAAGRQREGDLACVAAADVEPLAVRQRAHALERPLDATVPALGANLGEGGLADVLVVRETLARAVLAELEVQEQAPVTEEAHPTPVPSVSTHSSPGPSTTPSPCTAASLSMRAGRPKRLQTASTRGNPAQSLVPRLGAVITVTADHAREADRDAIGIRAGGAPDARAQRARRRASAPRAYSPRRAAPPSCRCGRARTP